MWEALSVHRLLRRSVGSLLSEKDALLPLLWDAVYAHVSRVREALSVARSVYCRTISNLLPLCLESWPCRYGFLSVDCGFSERQRA